MFAPPYNRSELYYTVLGQSSRRSNTTLCWGKAAEVEDYTVLGQSSRRLNGPTLHLQIDAHACAVSAQQHAACCVQCRQATSPPLCPSKGKWQSCERHTQCCQLIWSWTRGLRPGQKQMGSRLLTHSLGACRIASQCKCSLTCCPTLGTVNQHNASLGW